MTSASTLSAPRITRVVLQRERELRNCPEVGVRFGLPTQAHVVTFVCCVCLFVCLARLTAFVMKSFGGARPYIFVEPKHIEDARSWLAGHRRRDGCVTSVGKLFHNEMKVTASSRSVRSPALSKVH